MRLVQAEPETKLRADKDGWVNPQPTGRYKVTVEHSYKDGHLVEVFENKYGVRVVAVEMGNIIVDEQGYVALKWHFIKGE